MFRTIFFFLVVNNTTMTERAFAPFCLVVIIFDNFVGEQCPQQSLKAKGKRHEIPLPNPLNKRVHNVLFRYGKKFEKELFVVLYRQSFYTFCKDLYSKSAETFFFFFFFLFVFLFVFCVTEGTDAVIVCCV